MAVKTHTGIETDGNYVLLYNEHRKLWEVHTAMWVNYFMSREEAVEHINKITWFKFRMSNN